MNLGLPEIIIIILVVVVLFGITWAVRGKRFSKRTDNTGQAPKDKAS